MGTTKASNLSNKSSEKNLLVSPSKVKIQVEDEVR